jgi:hypothetical protein
MVKKRPHLLALIDAFKLEQEHTETMYIQYTTGRENKRQPRWAILEERVVNVIQDQILTPDLMEWLTNLSHLIQF